MIQGGGGVSRPDVLGTVRTLKINLCWGLKIDDSPKVSLFKDQRFLFKGFGQIGGAQKFFV